MATRAARRIGIERPLAASQATFQLGLAARVGLSYRPAMRWLLPLLLAVSACSQQEPKANDAKPVIEDGVPKAGVDRSKTGSPAPDVEFIDSDGETVTLDDFAGTPVLLNLWASWCAPCVKELPTLNALGEASGGRLKVLAVSQDSGPQASVRAFLAKLKVDGLGAYQDPAMGLSGALGAQVLPTSVLYDARGRELWRYTGDFDWTGAEAAKLLAEAGAAPAKD
jgi:thiol-disulfide isomerase/thioredoxin